MCYLVEGALLLAGFVTSYFQHQISGVKNAQLLPPAFVPLAVGRVRPSGKW